ncbi:MAG: tRNA 4-thiouridine(8) synthase ThiI, partial [Oscillospiraceae bacterium]|nr:tRNA 4-thiouridine(8) synthase ThiI [Oscillospiraceae bacterium]
KGLNRVSFETTLMRTMRKKLKSLGEFKVYKAQSTMYAEPMEEGLDIDEAFKRIQRTFGLAAVSRSCVVEKDFDAICSAAVTYLEKELRAAKTFKVEARRSDKKFPMNSMEIACEAGGYILSKYPHLKVDVHTPQLTVYVEVRDFGAYVHADKQQAVGGLPVGTSGKCAFMLSGGIDSPVAAYMMAKRGVTLMGIHFASPPYTSERAKMKVVSLAEKISVYTGGFVLQVVPFTEIQEYMRDMGPEPLFTVLMRRSMMRICEKLGNDYGCGGIITGESLAQVASQTLQAIACTDAAQSLPVLRPLIGMDKNEIVKISREIDTFETSILPYEDCCTVFTPPHPKTKPTLAEILAAEEKMVALPQMEAKAAAEIERIFINV